MNKKEKEEMMPYILWINLLIGFYNLYLFANGGDWFWNFTIGSLNIGAWVFYRNVE